MSQLSSVVKNLPWLNRAQKGRSSAKGPIVKMVVVGRGEKVPAAFTKTAPPLVKNKVKQKASVISWESKGGKLWLLQMKTMEPQNHYGMFTPSPYTMARDLMGTCFRQIANEAPVQLNVEYIGESAEELKGLCVGIELAQYRFKKVWPQANPLKTHVSVKTKIKNSASIIKAGGLLGEATNLARFLVDLPPNLLQPKDYADLLKAMFQGQKTVKVEVWNKSRLKKEKMGLHMAVGQASMQEPHMVHIQYRGAGKAKPIAFVGKGVTFDAGGLDIKPAAGMRLMKKDMGGSASVAGIAYWVIHSKAKINCDFYFAIAENSVAKESFRPGDVLTARNGKTVEIHNTDAEGRLVMADSLTVASEKKPKILIDIATLTGAIKYGLGGNVPGLFSNQDNLAECLLRSGQRHGDLCWRMPLIPEEKSRLKSDVADLVNCTNGYGGAITAALFLEMFTQNVPWAHFDIYAWAESAKGALAGAGGSGQIVQLMSDFLENESKQPH